VIYEHGEPWWKDIDRQKLLIRPLELSRNPTGKAGELAKEMNSALRSISFTLQSDF
jgi:hypothetical protein